MKKYDCLLLLVPDIQEEQVDNILKQVARHSMVQDIERIGTKRMAFPVKQANTKIHYVTAYHVLAKIKSEDEELKKLQKILDNNEEVVKVLNIRTERR